MTDSRRHMTKNISLQRFINHMNKWTNGPSPIIFYRLGLHVGAGSVSIAVVQDNKDGSPIKSKKVHVLTFDKGIDQRNGNTKNSKRRNYRSERRTNNRIQVRKASINHLFHKVFGLSASQELAARNGKEDIYALRVKALDNPITPCELYRIVYYFAGHRGYLQTKIAQSTQGHKILSKIKDTFNDWWHHRDTYRTIGELLCKAPKYQNMKRNRHGNYQIGITRTEIVGGQVSDGIKKHHITGEIPMIMKEQQNHDHRITDHFIQQCCEIIKQQRSYDDGPDDQSPYAGGILKNIGYDPYYYVTHQTYYLAPQATATFEYYRMLSNLNNLRIKKGSHWVKLTKSQRDAVIKLRYTKQNISFKQLVKALNLPKDIQFNNGDKKKFATLQATHKIGNCIHDLHNTDLIDKIGMALSLYHTKHSLKQSKLLLDVPRSDMEAIYKLAAKGLPQNKSFSKRARLSIHSMKMVIPFLEAGYDTTTALIKAGLKSRYPKKRNVSPADIQYLEHTYTNPVQRKIISVAFRALNAIVRKLGKPDFCTVSYFHDVKKSKHERQEITKHNHQNFIWKRNANKELKENGHLANHMNRLDLKLYERQGEGDIYPSLVNGKIVFKKLDKQKIFDGMNYTQIDHAQPISTTQNNSFDNLVLTTVAHNHSKGKRSPLQWLGHSNLGKAYIKHVNKLFPKWKKVMKADGTPKLKLTNKTDRKRQREAGKPVTKYKQVYRPINIGIRTNLLRVIPRRAQDYWQPRDMNNADTVAVYLHNFLRHHMIYAQRPSLYNHKYDKPWKQRTYVVSTRLLSLLRRSWNLKQPKYDKRHGANALITAIATPRLRFYIDLFYQKWSKLHYRPLFKLPYPSFKQSFNDMIKNCSVRRLASHRKNMWEVGDSKYSAKYLKYGLVMQHRHITDLKLKKNKKGKAIIGYNNYAWRMKRPELPKKILNAQRPMFKMVEQALGKAKDHSGKSAFPKGYLNNHGVPVYKLPIFKPAKPDHYIVSKQYHCVRPHSEIAGVNVYRKGKSYYGALIHPFDLSHHHRPTLTINGKHLDKSYHYCFTFHMFDPVEFTLKTNKTFKFGSHNHKGKSKPDRKITTRHFKGVFRRISGNQLLVQPADMTSLGDRTYYTGASLGQMISLNKLQPTDFFGDEYNPI